MAAISAQTLRSWLFGEEELALLDVREVGQGVLAHILFSAPAPYSRFEARLPELVPNTAVRIVLCDGGDGIAERAAAGARSLGYTQVHWLDGGVAAWGAAGYTLYQGVNVPSKVFGELIEHADDTPRLSAADVATMQAEGADMVIVDGRPLEEFDRFSIPGGMCCPNGELAVRIGAIAPDPNTTVIVNCAGRTRSIIGAQTLKEMGIANPVYALENGTQGWSLAGLHLQRGNQGTLSPMVEDLALPRARAHGYGVRHGVEAISPATIDDWTAAGRTVYLADVRTTDERTDDPAALQAALGERGVFHAPGGQLVQATDTWIGVRHARIVVLDTEDIRAWVVAAWLRRLGHDAAVLQGGIGAVPGLSMMPLPPRFIPDNWPKIAAVDLADRMKAGTITALDLRSSGDFLQGHPAGAHWTSRPILSAAGPVALIANDIAATSLAARDLQQAGADPVILDGGMDAWHAADLPVETGGLAEADRIDFLSFTHGRHDGNENAMRQYLAWEIALVDQLDADERAVFRLQG